MKWVKKLFAINSLSKYTYPKIKYPFFPDKYPYLQNKYLFFSGKCTYLHVKYPFSTIRYLY